MNKNLKTIYLKKTPKQTKTDSKRFNIYAKFADQNYIIYDKKDNVIRQDFQLHLSCIYIQTSLLIF